MEWYWWAVILFFVGVLEHILSEYENLVSVRLKVGQTVLFAEINLVLDFIVSVIWFMLLMDFWSGLEKGVLSLDRLVPYLIYIQGCVLGSALALLHYRKRKRRLEKQKKLMYLEKARLIKKQLQELENDLNVEMEIETEAEFDDNIEQEKKNADKEVQNKADVHKPSVKEEKRDKDST